MKKGQFVVVKGNVKKPLLKNKVYCVLDYQENKTGKYIKLDPNFKVPGIDYGNIPTSWIKLSLFYIDTFTIKIELSKDIHAYYDNQTHLTTGFKFKTPNRTNFRINNGIVHMITLNGKIVFHNSNKWAKIKQKTPSKSEKNPMKKFSKGVATILTPKNKEEYLKMVDYAIAQGIKINEDNWKNKFWERYADKTRLFLYSSDGETLNSMFFGDVEHSMSEQHTDALRLSVSDFLNDTFSQPEGETKNVDLSQIIRIIREYLGSEENRENMSADIKAFLEEWGVDIKTKPVTVQVGELPKVEVGLVHNRFETVLNCMVGRINTALVGPAGSGKTSTVAKAAEALNLKFYSKSVSAQTGAHEFFGYQDVQGRYVRTLFREAYEHGGVFLLDEFDAGNPNVLAALNQATANEYCAFADGMIKKHDDFICVMAGNTFGHGANSEYVGRNKIDAATLDRFAFIDFPYDEKFEMAIAPNKEWCKRVQRIRKEVTVKKIRTVVSPRATLMGAKLLSQGMSEENVMELLIYKGLNQTERDLIKGV